MTKTIKVDKETHDLIKHYMKEHNISTFGEAVENAVKQAEGVIDETGWIVSTRDTLGGQPRIKNTRVGILSVHVWYFEEGMSVSEISENYDVEEEGLKAVVDYIENNEEEIQKLKEEQEMAEKVSQKIAEQRLQEMLG